MTDGLIHDHSISALPESHTPSPRHKKRQLDLGVYLTIGLLVGLTGGVLGGFIGLILGEIVRVNFVPGFKYSGPEWYQTTEFLGAVVGFVVLGMVWGAVALWLLARR